ncbi:hypothetical protein NH340_JMT04493 [Sarcoptes scabiei]|nr:hypothetical protein NH340_JMT04493 [Sarcoptes scabiei]
MDENASQDQDFSKLSIEERVNHKNWKARVSGYEELTKYFPQFEEKEFQRYIPLIKKFVIDTNAAAQEKGLAATLAFVDYCPQAGKVVETIVANIAVKCLTATRAKTKELANEIVLMCVEIDKQDAVVEELVKALDQKNPKNVAATIAILRKCLNLFGSKVISIKPIISHLPKLLEDRDHNVREETKQLTIEIYRWIKDALMPQLNSLKPILLQELQVEFEKFKDLKPHPERLLRSQQQKQECVVDSVGNTETINQKEEEIEEEIDPFDLLEPVDIFVKLPNDFFTLIEAKKWTERKDGLEKLQQILEANPKLVGNADYGELVKQLKKIISKDSNIVVATIAIKSMGLLANGLRKNFQNHANSSVPILLEKFKEKKAVVVQALREAIDAIYTTTFLEAIQEDLVASLDNKNPSIRGETALFLARSFAKTNPSTINKKLLKTLTTSLLKTLSDSDATVRESSAEALGTALKAQGDRNMTPFLQGLEALKMTKIEEYRNKVEVKKFANVVPQTEKNPPTKPKTQSVKSTSSRPASQKQETHHVSNESVNADTATASKSKSKIAVSSKSKIGINTQNSDSQIRSIKSGGINKIGSSSRIGTSSKSSSQSSTNIANSTSTNLTKKPEQELGPLMNGNIKSKDQRFADEKALKVLKWNFSTPREEFFQLLKEQMIAAEWQAQLITYCFHADFKFHIKAIDIMRDFFQKSSDSSVVIANLDLILKWFALRFFDTNPSVITKALELLLIVFSCLCEQSNQYILNDIEANSFIPYLVLKFGDPKDAVRNKVHDILVKIRNIYPANKIFAHLFTALQSKNARQRATCLEEISQLIELRGMSIFQSPNSIQMVKDLAKFISERDNAVRNSALSCIVQIYFLEGEKVFKLIGSLSDKEMSLVEERIKRASKNRPNPSQTVSHSNSEAINGSPISSQSNLPSASSGGSLLKMRNPQPESGIKGINLFPCSNGSEGSLNGLSKLHSFSNLNTQSENSPQKSHDIGATFSKSRSASNLLRKGMNFTPIKSSGLIQSTKIQQNKFVNSKISAAEDDAEISDSDDNYAGQKTNVSPALNQAISSLESQEESTSDAYSTNEDDEIFRQKLEQALNLPEIKIHRQYRNPSSKAHVSNSSEESNTDTPKGDTHHSKFQSSPELNQKFANMFSQLSSTELPIALKAMECLNVSLKDYEKYLIYLEPKVDQIIILCNKQYRLFLSKHYPAIECDDPEEKEQRKQNAETLFRSTSSVLNKLFKSPLGKKVSRDTLRELLTHLLTYFAEMRSHQNMFNSVNFLIGIVFNGSDATNLFSALIRMLHDYTGNTTVQHSDKFLEITMKFIWRITKNLNNYIDDLNIDQILLESHLFFKAYPRNWWKVSNRDDIPLRTIKTLVYYIVGSKGDSILDHFTLIKNKDESELSYYVQKALRQCDKIASLNISNTTKNSNTSQLTTTPISKSNGHCQNELEEQKDQNFENSNILVDKSRLKLRQISTESGKLAQIPIIQNDNDLKNYIEYTADKLNLPDLNYEMIKTKQHHIHSLEDAKLAVESAKQRLAQFKNFLGKKNTEKHDCGTSAN